MTDIDYHRSLLVTDLYQLNMVEAYLAEEASGRATFELFARKLPPSRGFLVAAGLAQAVRFLLEARVDPAEIDWLRSTGRITERLLRFLEDFRFTGDVDAPPEGSILFPDQPLIRVTAPVAQAQLVETRLIGFLHHQTLIASKAARMALAAPDAALVDFGLRRAHGGEAGVLGARAAWIGGFAGTASVAAGRAFGLPLMGTMAHSFVQTHEREADAFCAFARARPGETTFLIDTYDVSRGAERVAALAPALAAEGIPVSGVRIDSGDLAAHARRVRAILDGAGLGTARIIVSGGLDEHDLARIVASGAPIDGYGIGTSLVTSQDQPALDMAYKLKAYAGRPARKLSEGKSYWPGPTQVWRRLDRDGRLLEDVVATADEAGPSGASPLLEPVMRDGAVVSASVGTLDAARRRAAAGLAALPEALRRLDRAPPHSVRPSARLAALAEETTRRLGG